MAKKMAALLMLTAMSSMMAAQQKPSPVLHSSNSPAQQLQKPNVVSSGDPASLPAGTEVKMKLETMLSSTASRPGDAFSGRVTQDVMSNGKVVIPVGASIEGTVLGANEPRRIHGHPYLDLRPDQIIMPDGDRYAVSMMVTATDPESQTSVNGEGRINGPGRERRDTYELAGGAGAGTLIGAKLGGAEGALIGATIGAGAAVAHWMTKRYQAVLPPGTEITMQLERPMVMTASTANSGN